VDGEHEEFKIDENTPMELVSKQYISGKDIRISAIRELRQKYSTSFHETEKFDDIEGGSTLEITYDLRGSGLTYKTATNLALFPQNDKIDVD